MSLVRDVCVIGLGLIGGSLLKAAATAGRTTWGATNSEVDAQAAVKDGYQVDTDVVAALHRATERDAIVVLAVPLPALEEVLTQVAAHAAGCLLTDVISVKSPVRHALAAAIPAARYVGGHPMAGGTHSGWSASHEDLFDNAAWAVCVEQNTDLSDWLEVAQLALDVGAKVVPVSATEHDEAVARISHLPHLLAAVLAAVGADGGPLALSLAAGSYASGTRVAATRSELTRAMTEGNRVALLPVLDEALGRLGAARGSLASTGGLAAAIHEGHKSSQLFDDMRTRPATPVRLDLSAIDAKTALLALGGRGGRVISVTDTIALCEMPGQN